MKVWPYLAKSLQSCLTMCDPIDGQPTRLLHPRDSPGKNTGVGCHFLLQCVKVKVKSLSHVQLVATRWTAAYQAPPSTGFSRQEDWSGVPLPSPMALPGRMLSSFFWTRVFCLFVLLHFCIFSELFTRDQYSLLI